MSAGQAFPVDVRKQTGFFESYDGTKIYYEVRGQGKPIVLCYGIACLINHWSQQIKSFSHGYQTIVFDYRGHHQSGTPKDLSQLTPDAICRDINGLVNHLGIEKASYWGHSYGAQLLMRYYDLYPEKVANFVFINGFASNPIAGMFGGVLGPTTIETFFKFFKQGYDNFPAALSAFWKSAVMSPVAIPIAALAGGFNLSLSKLKDVEVYARGVASMDLEVFLTLFEQMMKYDGTGVLDKITCPTLIISGSKDGVTPLSHQERMHQRIKGSQFLRVPYGTHCTQLDLPDYVNLRIEKFLKEIGYKPTPSTNVSLTS